MLSGRSGLAEFSLEGSQRGSGLAAEFAFELCPGAGKRAAGGRRISAGALGACAKDPPILLE